MEKGFLLLTGNYYDLVHYIEIEGVYYTLSRDNVEKITDIDNSVEFYIKKVDIKQLKQMRPTDPFYFEEPKLSEKIRLDLKSDDTFKAVSININRDQEAINKFQKLSVENHFAYFRDISNEQVVLLEYKER